MKPRTDWQRQREGELRHALAEATRLADSFDTDERERAIIRMAELARTIHRLASALDIDNKSPARYRR